MLKGKVEWFSAKKGYGFITDATGESVFCHYSAIQADGFKTLEKGQEVTFELSEDGNGRKLAACVTPV